MKIWRLDFDVDHYENLFAGDSFDYIEFHARPGKSKKQGWKPIKVVRMYPQEDLPLGDAPGFTVPVFSIKAKNALSPLIAKNVEFLPLDFAEKTFFAVNVLTILEGAVDLSQCKYYTFPNGRVMWINEYVFNKHVAEKAPIFKIAEEPKRCAFVSDAFQDIIVQEALEGFKLELVWEG